MYIMKYCETNGYTWKKFFFCHCHYNVCVANFPGLFLDFLNYMCCLNYNTVPGHVGTVWEFPLHAAEHGGVCETAADHRHSDHHLPRPRGCRLLLMPSSVHICNQCKSLLILLSLVRKLQYYFTL